MLLTKTMSNKLRIAFGGGLFAGLLFLSQMAHAQLTTTTLGNRIDTLNATVLDTVDVLISKYWIYVVGFIVLVGVWAFGKRIVRYFTGA